MSTCSGVGSYALPDWLEGASVRPPIRRLVPCGLRGYCTRLEDEDRGGGEGHVLYPNITRVGTF